MSSTSHSEVSLFRKCMKAHDYRYGQRLQRKKPILPMLKGKILHEMLHEHTMAKQLSTYKGDAWDVLEKYAEEYKKYFEEEREEIGDPISDCENIFLRYLSRYKDDELTYEKSEIFVATDLLAGKEDPIRFIGYIDKIAVDPQGRRWIMDHKFMKSIPDSEGRFHELQLILYLWAWNRWNPSQPVDGIIWDYVRTALPTEPRVLASGELSQAKNIRCDVETYKAAIKRESLDPDDYKAFLKTLKRNDLMFFERVPLPAPSKKMLDLVVEDFRTTAAMIQHMKGIAPRSMSKFNCQGCEFKQLCEAEVRGLDSNFVKKAHYMPREKFDGGKKEKGTKKKVSKKKRATKRKRNTK